MKDCAVKITHLKESPLQKALCRTYLALSSYSSSGPNFRPNDVGGSFFAIYAIVPEIARCLGQIRLLPKYIKKSINTVKSSCGTSRTSHAKHELNLLAIRIVHD